MRERRIADGLWNGLVSANKARAHIRKLGRSGVGYKSVALAAGISKTVMFKIRRGLRKNVRALTEKRILEVDSRLGVKRGSTLVRATDTWRLIDEMLSEGFTKSRIANELGRKTHALQLNRNFVTASNAKAVEALWRKYQ